MPLPEITTRAPSVPEGNHKLKFTEWEIGEQTNFHNKDVLEACLVLGFSAPDGKRLTAYTSLKFTGGKKSSKLFRFLKGMLGSQFNELLISSDTSLVYSLLDELKGGDYLCTVGKTDSGNSKLESIVEFPK